MAEDLYNKKLSDLQKHIPFMENMIAQLKDPKCKPREAQLNKMESLYSMITDRNKKWKYETLLKCEEVILKLQSKVKANRPIFPAEKKEQFMNPERPDIVSNAVSDIMNALKFNNARAKLNSEIMSTPKSPSPVREVIPQHAPKIIPFEATNEPTRKLTNIIDPNELSVTWNNERHDRYVNEKPDIYASAAKSLGVVPTAAATATTTAAAKVSIFDRLGPVVPEVNERPLLSDADLEMLRAGDDFLVICQNDQQNHSGAKEKSLSDINLKVTPRIAPVPASKPKMAINDANVIVASKDEKCDKSDKHSKKDLNKETKKSDKIITSDIFGNCLSSIDNMILEDSKKKDKKKDERRHSSDHKREHKSHESKHHHSKHKSKDKDRDKDKEYKTKDGRKSKDDPRLSKIDHVDKLIKESSPITLEKMAEKIMECKEKIPGKNLDNQVDKPKRLADKYNPKPRKHSEFVPAIPVVPPPPQLPIIPIVPPPQEKPVENFECRDPRRRQAALLPTPTSLLGNPPFQPQIPINPALAPFLTGTVQQPTISPTPPIPLMQIPVQPPQDYQPPPPPQATNWYEDADFQRTQNPIFEAVQKYVDTRVATNRGVNNFHQDNQGIPERLNSDPRRQPRFSPPPGLAANIQPQFGNANFIPSLYPTQPNLNFVPAMQRNMFEQAVTAPQQNRFEPPPTPRYDMPPSTPPIPQITPPPIQTQNNLLRKSFCPFEPLESSKDKDEKFPGGSQYHNQGNYRNFRNSFGQYGANNRADRFDRYGRKLSRDDVKPVQRQDGFNKEKYKPLSKEDRSVKTEDDHEKSKSVSATDSKELTHTKYDEIYSKLDVEKESFSSPLESLYSNAKTAAKSTMLSFKIPKKPKPEPPPPSQPAQSSSPNIEDSKKDLKIKLEEEKPPIKSAKERRSSKTSLEGTLKDLSEKKDDESDIKTPNISEDVSGNESDDIPIGKRIRRRTKRLVKKKVIRDSEDESDLIEEEEAEAVEEAEETKIEIEEETTASGRPKRSTRQSAIKANKLLRKKPQPIIKAKRRAARTKPAPIEVEVEEAPAVEEAKIEDAIKEEPVKKEDEIDAADDIKAETVEPSEVVKAKEELLSEAKKKNLNLNDQGAEVLQFILMNYKKIKKIFKSDSSSEDEEKIKKKKKKKREKSRSSSSESESDKDAKKEMKKHNKETEIESDDKVKDEKQAIIEDKPAEKPEEETDEKLDEVGKSDTEVESKNETETSADVDQGEIALKGAGRRIRRVTGRRGKLVRKKFQGRITRNRALQSPTKKARRSELDKLHDDIKEMLMGGEVLTATGKRACTIPKDDSDESKRGDAIEDQSSTSLESVGAAATVIPAKGLRVLIEKTDIEKLLVKDVPSKDVELNSGGGSLTQLEKASPASPPNKGGGKKKILRKKKYRWASGFLKRKNKRKTSGSEDKPLQDLVKVEKEKPALHDKNYYVDGPKNQCKLCGFRGKLVIQHYKSAHPESEVLISRLDPKTTEHLIREAKDKKYDLIELQHNPTAKKLRYGFKCPFKCLIGTTVDTFENYYDHITSHTGEHRYFCPFCNFTTFNPRNLRAHMVPQHNSNLENYGKPTVASPPPSKYMFGYVCAECHYVQTSRSKLESHVADHHDGNGEIVRINLSLICQEQVDGGGLILESASDNTLMLQSTKRQDHINECIESVVNGAGSIKNPEPALVKDLNIFELMSQIEAEELPPVLVKMEPVEVEPDLNALIPEIQLEEPQIARNKDPDLTVFMCRSDLPVDDEETIEQRRLKKMNEIHESCKPSRTTIVDKLQSKLDTVIDNQNERVPTPPPQVSSPIISVFSRPPPLIPIERAKKSLDSIAKNLVTTEVSLSPKNVAPISNIINRLQDKLLPSPGTSTDSIMNNDSPTSSSTSSPARESTGSLEPLPSASILHIGPVMVTSNRNREMLYSCFVPFCVFNTMNAQIFETHCRTTHRDFVYGQNKCDACGIKIDHDDTFVSMHDVYRHITTCHQDFLESVKKMQVVSDTCSEASLVQENVDDVEAAGQQAEVVEAEPPRYPFKIADVTGAPEIEDNQSQEAKQQDNETGKKYPFVIKSITSAEQPPAPKPSAEKTMIFTLPHKVPNLISQANNGNGPKFPFIITSVTSLAKKPVPIAIAPKIPPPLTSITSTQPTETTSTILNTILTTSAQINTTASSAIQTKTQTIPSTIQTNAVPIILNPLAPENQAKIQLPVITSIQSLAPVRKDLIRPVPLDQLTSNVPATPPVISPSTTTTGDKILRPTAGVVNVSLVGNDGSTLTLQDIPLNLQERYTPRKSPTVYSEMLADEVVARFYKCPQFRCSFSCDKPQEFLQHLGTHPESSSTYVPCLYCDYKTSFKMYLIHLEVQHSNCEFSCGKCFYRATNAAFVLAHNRSKHKDKPIVVRTPREFMPSRKTPTKLVPIKSILKHYICGHPGCNLKTVFSSVYLDHLLNQHDNNKVPCGVCRSPHGNSTGHWSSHGIFSYHCRYCPTGSNTYSVVVNHQALLHPKMDYCIIQRKFMPNPNFPERTASYYRVEDDATYDRLLIIYGGGSDTANDDPQRLPEETPTIPPIPPPPPRPALTNPTPENRNDDNDLVFLDVQDLRNAQGDPQLGGSSDEPEISIMNVEMDEAVTDPLSFDSRDVSSENFSDGCDSNDEKSGDNDAVSAYDAVSIVNKYNEEYTGAMLYKCVCGLRFEDRVKFRQHVIECGSNKTFKCAHCGVSRKNVRNLLTHLNEHGKKRFKCSLCQFKHVSKRFVKDHMNIEHNVHEMMLLPATVTKKVDYYNDDFVLRPKLSPLKKLTAVPASEVPSANKTIFSPKEIDQLPRPPIYQTDVFCSVCNYATKVKSNMVRHLQAHQNEQAVPETAPVNPVPCLEKSEKMFDKMVNLALSSHSGGKMGGGKPEKIDENNVPGFVPINKRFVCGADSCNYLCPEESMLRRHLTTFHSLELNYTCLHCNTKLFEDKIINVDLILKHLKLHDNHLYGCGLCKFIHNLKHKVERHLADKHADKPQAFVTIRELGKETEGEPGVAPSAEKEELKKPWRCGMCKFRCANIEDVKTHTQVKHNVAAKQKCALCEFGSEDAASFGKHFELSHSGQGVDVIVTYYKEDEVQQKPDTDPEFNTTPLWQRNKSVKHIRGILLEESNNKTPKATVQKKPKVSKLKKGETEKVEDPNLSSPIDVTKKISLKKDILISDAPKGGNDLIKKCPPKRRKSKIDLVKLQVKGDATKAVEVAKSADNEVIFINNSDEDNSQAQDVINIDDLAEIKIKEDPGDVNVFKPKIIKISKLSTINSDKSVNVKEKIPEIIEITEENDDKTVDKVLVNESDDVIEISNETNRQLPIITSVVSVNDPPDRNITKGLNNIFLEDSSTEDSDVVEIITSNESETAISRSDEDSPLKNIKVVSVRSLKDTFRENQGGEILVEEGGEPSSKKLKLDITISEIETMSKLELLNGNFVGTYGPYGFPWNGSYKCPLCEKYLSNSTEEFVSHLYKELQYGMYKCTTCDFTDSVKSLVINHHKSTHKDVQTEERVKLNLDQQIIDWVDKLTIFQSRILTLDKEEVLELQFYCHFCEYRCAAQSDMRKHQVRHWTIPPYTCGMCQYKGIQRSVIVKHIARSHPKAAITVNEQIVGPEVVIKRVRMNSRFDKNDDKLKSMETLETECDTDANLDDLKDVLLNCGYCTFRDKLDGLKKHHTEEHPDLKLRGYRYRCNYCTTTFVFQRSVDQHFILCHSGMRHSYSNVNHEQKLYTCSECPVSEDKLITMEDHLRSHFKPIKCLYCGLRTVYWKTMKRHHNEKHRGENFEFSYLITEEKRYEAALSKVKETNNSIVINSKKRKRLDDDLTISDDNLNYQEAASSTSTKKNRTKQVARKSTGTRNRIELVQSHYGRKPSTEDLATTVTTIDVMGAPVTMNIIRLSKILNLSPVVLVEDCQNQL